jgi:hypothetical protein
MKTADRESPSTEDDDLLTPEEYSLIKAIRAKLESGDETDFLDWGEVSKTLAVDNESEADDGDFMQFILDSPEMTEEEYRAIE